MTSDTPRPSKRGHGLRAKGPAERGSPADTKVAVTERSYSEGDLVPMDDGLYQAVGPSRLLAFNPDQYVTTIRRSDLEACR